MSEQQHLLLRSALQIDKESILERRDVLLGKLSDPYDTYDYQLKLNEKYNIDVVYFFLLADYGINDKNCYYTVENSNY